MSFVFGGIFDDGGEVGFMKMDAHQEMVIGYMYLCYNWIFFPLGFLNYKIIVLSTSLLSHHTHTNIYIYTHTYTHTSPLFLSM